MPYTRDFRSRVGDHCVRWAESLCQLILVVCAWQLARIHHHNLQAWREAQLLLSTQNQMYMHAVPNDATWTVFPASHLTYLWPFQSTSNRTVCDFKLRSLERPKEPSEPEMDVQVLQEALERQTRGFVVLRCVRDPDKGNDIVDFEVVYVNKAAEADICVGPRNGIQASRLPHSTILHNDDFS